jgi:salicylate hydroxylase
VIDIAEEKPGKMLHRAALLHELLQPIPKDRLHANKKLAKVEIQEDGLLLKFEDGAEVRVDALIGADGIFGMVRAHVLGADHDAVQPVAAGWAGAMNMVPYPKAEAKLGTEILNDNRQYGWVSDGGIFIHDTIMGGKMVQCIGTSVNRDTSGARRIPINREHMNKAFANCLEEPVAKGMIDASYSPLISCIQLLTTCHMCSSCLTKKARRCSHNMSTPMHQHMQTGVCVLPVMQHMP